MRHLMKTDIDGQAVPRSGEVHYLQSQNGNMFTDSYFDMSGEDEPSEFEPLREHVPSEIPWCSEALGKKTAHE